MALFTSMAIGGGISAYLQYRAAKKASEQQGQSAQDALAVQQQQYQQSRQDLGPYRQQGGQGLTALSGLLGMPTPGPEPPPVPLGGVPQPGAMVMLRAPNGQQKAVPANQVDYYVSRGATRG